MISIEQGAVNTHSIVSKAEMPDRELTTVIHCFQHPDSEPIFAVQCKALYFDDNSVVIHKFTLTQAGFANLILAWEDLIKDPEKYKHEAATV